MNFFQIIVPIIIVFFFILISRSRIVIVERLFYIVITIAGIFFIVFPESASSIAKFIGIGRGADLIFYLFILFSWFWFTSASVKARLTDRRITKIVRNIAISQPLNVPDEYKKQLKDTKLRTK